MEWLKRYCISSMTERTHKTSTPFKGGRVTKQLSIALLLCRGVLVKSRKEILEKIGSEVSHGYNASLFQTLMMNEVIEYEKGVGYKRGNRYREYMEHCYVEMNRLGISDKGLRDKIVGECSNAMHFIENIE